MFSCSGGSDCSLSTLLFLGWGWKRLIPNVGTFPGDYRGGERSGSLSVDGLLFLASSSPDPT